MADNLTAIKTLSNTALSAQTQIEEYTKSGRLSLPVNYSAGNAIKQFQLMVQDDYKLMSCTQTSLHKCMIDMAVLGLNPAKKQCYAIPYGDKATLMPSYLGKVAIAKRINPNIKDIVSKTVHKGEEFEFELKHNGYYSITRHVQTLETMAVNDPLKDIVGAYATIIYADGSDSDSLLMPMSEIIKRWKKSKQHPFDNNGKLNPESVHAQFPDRMCERTLVSAICMPIISKSDDSDLFGSTVSAVNYDAQVAEANTEADENMCTGETIDIEADFEEAEQPVENSDNNNDELF